MASWRGRMLQGDEDKIQRCTAFIEREVEAKDLTTHLFSTKILDFNDRREIDDGVTRVERIRRLLDMLIMRGPYAYQEFTRALASQGYDQVLRRLADDPEFSLESKLAKIDVILNQLCKRITLLESRHNIGRPEENNIADLKKQLNFLKTDNMTQIRDLIEENSKKNGIIAQLKAMLEEKKKKLQEAEERIKTLEGKLKELEDRCKNYKQDITILRIEALQQAERVQRTERRMKQQDETLGTQQKKLDSNSTDMIDMKSMMKKMASDLEEMRNTVDEGKKNGQCKQPLVKNKKEWK